MRIDVLLCFNGAMLELWPVAFRRAESASATCVSAAAGACRRRDRQVGILQVDWSAGTVLLKTPSIRRHSSLFEPGGAFLAVATRPGTWILRG